MRADIKILLRPCGVAYLAAGLLLGASAAFVEGLHPERFCNVSNRFREPVKRRRARIEARGQALPPGIEQRIDGVGRAAADLLADPFNRRALTLAQERIGGELDIAASDAARGRAVARGRGSRFCHVRNYTAYI